MEDIFRSIPAPTAAAPTDTCERCSGMGYTIVKNVATPCDCGLAADYLARSLAGAADIPPRFRGKTFETFKPADRADKERRILRDWMRNYAASFRPGEKGLVLRGSTGCGKTHLACAILQAVLLRGHSGYFTTFGDLLGRIRETFRENSPESEESILSMVETVDLLVLDDLGAESSTDFVRDRLYTIINRRYESQRTIVLTTNLDEAELEARVGARVVSRLAEMCEADIPPFPRQDYRRANLR